MNFYGREEEIKQLNETTRQANDSGRMTVITGRRRIGKTLLSLEITKGKKYLYLFVSKKTEKLLCEDFIEAIKEKFDFPIIGEIKRFKDVFKLLLEIGKKENFILIIDEFQEFYRINSSIYSDIQNLWDQNKREIKIHLIFIGSVHSLMIQIFQNSKEPLFGRSDRIIYLKPFKVKTIKKIIDDTGNYSVENLFYIYLITGGVPKYLEILTDNNLYKINKIIDFILSKNSPFLDEGKNLLIEEFGKEYGTYFSILELMAMGRTSRGEIESILEMNISGFLDRLEKEYEIISKRRPFNAKQTGKIQKYYIKDNFINFWFRFIHKNKSSLETGNIGHIKKIIQRDLSTYSGQYLEKLFHELLSDKHDYNIIGNYWERGNINEIDIVAINEIDKKMLIGEVKINIKKINIKVLKEKALKIEQKYREYSIEYKGFGLENIDNYIDV